MKQITISILCGIVTLLFVAGCKEDTPAEKIEKGYSSALKNATDSAKSLSDKISEKSSSSLK